MNEENIKSPQAASVSQPTVSFLALGGLEDVTRNMYLYEYNNQILIVDCGLGFPDETMPGVDLLLPDIAYLLDAVKAGKKIVGMVLTHGHEDHIGGVPFILPQLLESKSDKLSFPIFASPLTTALTNEKLLDFKLPQIVQSVSFENSQRQLGDFTVNFVRVTHSVPDSANIIIKTPAGNFFHGSDYKFDFTPADGRRTEFNKIMQAAEEGFLALISDCLGSDRPGFTASEEKLGENFEREMREARGKCLITTYSSNISRMNQAIQAAQRVNRKVCFVGRSVVKCKQIGERLGYLQLKAGTEIQPADVKNYKNNQVMLIVAGSQGQENSAMTRIANGEHKELRLDPLDVVIFSSDTIPGNELSVNALYDTISKKGAKVVHSTAGAFHVSGHGSEGDHMLLVALTKPKFLLPISGTYRHMVAYKDMAQRMGYKKNDIFLVENGSEVLFAPTSAKFGKKVATRNIFVDEVSGGEVENYVIQDRERLGKEGLVVVLAEVKSEDGQLAAPPEVILRGSSLPDVKGIAEGLTRDLTTALNAQKGKVSNWIHIRKLVGNTANRYLFKKFRTRPLILPVVIEV